MAIDGVRYRCGAPSSRSSNNRAQVRYWLWVSTSLKFFVPFALLMSIGRYVQPLVPSVHRLAGESPIVVYTIEQFSQPLFPRSAQSAPEITDLALFVIFCIWLCGFMAIALMRLRSWFHIRAAVRISTAINIPAMAEVRLTPGLLEPGIVGCLRPIILLPDGILERLTPSELTAVLAHELFHVRRHDNLFASIHMLVEAIFWFHPIVWWIGAHLVEERERACDEEVLRIGNQPDVYANAILNVCKLYLESPLGCVSGIGGASVRKRVETILFNRRAQGVNHAKKVLLAGFGVAALAGSFVIGLLISVGDPSPTLAQSKAAVVSQAQAPPKYEVSSIKPNADSDFQFRFDIEPNGILYATGITLRRLMMTAYQIQGFRLIGGPDWVSNRRWDVQAKPSRAASNKQVWPMLRGLLEDRFQLRVHSETRNMPVYELTVGPHGSKLQAVDGSNIKLEIRTGNGLIRFTKATVATFASQLSYALARPVIDKTGISGEFSFDLEWTSIPGENGGPITSGLPTGTPEQPYATPNGPSIFTAIEQQLGLRLKSARGPVEVLVIDTAQMPTAN